MPSARKAPKLWPAAPVKRACTEPGGRPSPHSRPMRPAERGADGAVGVGDRVVELDVLALPQRRKASSVSRSPSSERGRWMSTPATKRRGPSGSAGGREQVRQVERVGPGVAGRPAGAALDPADGLVERAQPERGQQAPHLLGDEQQVGGHALGGAGELGPQVGPLGGDAGRAGVLVAGPHHDAALGDHRRGAEGVLVGAEQGGHQHVAAGHEAAVDPHPHPVPQVVVDERPLGVGQARAPTACRRA